MHNAYQHGFSDMVKQAWIFSGPLGVSDVAQAVHIPKYIKDTAQGGDPKDPRKSPWRSAGMAGLAAGGALFGLGFAGMGMRDLGLKMSLIAKRIAKNRIMTTAEKDLAHRMDVPAYTRFNKGMSSLSGNPYLSKTLGAVGTAAGGIAHPFNKLEDSITKGLVKAVGPTAAESLGGKLHLTSQGRIFDNKPVRIASSLAALPVLVAGDALFAPYDPLDKKSSYTQGFMQKAAQFRSIGEMGADAMGGGTGAQIGSMVPYFIPGVGTAASIYDAGAQVGNMFSPDKTMMQRAGHGGAVLGNLGFAALNAIPLIGPTASTLIRGAVKSAPVLSKAAPIAKYLKGETAWQQGVKSMMPRSPLNKLPFGPVQPGKALPRVSLASPSTWALPFKAQKGNWGNIAKNYAHPVNFGSRVGGVAMKSPTLHSMALIAGGGGMGGGAEGAEQGAAEGLAKGVGVGASEAYGLSPWQMGARDYYRSIR